MVTINIAFYSISSVEYVEQGLFLSLLQYIKEFI